MFDPWLNFISAEAVEFFSVFSFAVFANCRIISCDCKHIVDDCIDDKLDGGSLAVNQQRSAHLYHSFIRELQE